MDKIKSLDELKKVKEQAVANTELWATPENPEHVTLLVGMATCGIASGAREVMDALSEEILGRNLQNVSVVATGCLGYCYAEPLVEVRMPGMEPIRYGNVDAKRAVDIVDKHVINGELLDNAIIGRGQRNSEVIPATRTERREGTADE